MNLQQLVDVACMAESRSDEAQAYLARHGVAALPRATITDEEIAQAITDLLEPRLRGKTVIDLGGANGFLGMHLSRVARKVFVIEANPVWTWSYVEFVHRTKPANLSFVFGAASECVGAIEADVAVVATHSDVPGMMDLARRLASEAIDVYGELIEANPAAFDNWAREARARS